jgi:hypothetical protein
LFEKKKKYKAVEMRSKYQRVSHCLQRFTAAILKSANVNHSGSNGSGGCASGYGSSTAAMKNSSCGGAATTPGTGGSAITGSAAASERLVIDLLLTH